MKRVKLILKNFIETLLMSVPGIVVVFFIMSLVSCEVSIEENKVYRGPLALVKSIELIYPNRKLCKLQFSDGAKKEFFTILLPDTVSFNVGDSLEFVKYKK